MTTENEKKPPTETTAIEKSKDPTAPMARWFRETVEKSLVTALPKHLSADRMARVTLTAIRTVKDLWRCTPVSFSASILGLAQLGLEPNTQLGHAYLIPRIMSRSQSWECTVIVGYQGYLELARRSGLVRGIYAHVVRDGEEFDFERGLHQKLVHRGKAPYGTLVTHAYAVAHLVDAHADPLFEVLARDEIEARRRIGASGSNHSTPWDTHYDAMAKKSALRALWAWLPKSAEMAEAAALDSDGRPMDVEPAPAAVATGTIASLNATFEGAIGSPITSPEAPRPVAVRAPDTPEITDDEQMRRDADAIDAGKE